jgi:hypothetical protein
MFSAFIASARKTLEATHRNPERLSKCRDSTRTEVRMAKCEGMERLGLMPCGSWPEVYSFP